LKQKTVISLRFNCAFYARICDYFDYYKSNMKGYYEIY
jgi:hypothetical protein